MKYLKTFEALNLESELYDILDQLSDKGDKVARLLINIYDENLYSDNEELNVLAISPKLNMIKFKPLKKRSPGLFDPKGMEDIRLGKAVKKIWQSVNNKLNYNIEGAEGWLGRYAHHQKNKYVLTFEYNEKIAMFTEFPLNFSLKIGDKKIYPKFENVSEVGIFRPGVKSSLQQITFDYDGELPHLTMNVDGSNLKEDNKIKFDLKLSINEDITDSDIENFVNKFMGFLKLYLFNTNKSLKLVKGNKIGFWYDRANIATPIGDLSKSCMAKDECKTFFEIYKQNPDRISLLTLCNSENKLLGRALVWKLDDNRIYMDRIYTSLVSDKYFMQEWAIKKGWMIYERDYSEEMVVSLKKWSFDTYPHLDTLQYLDIINGKLSNSTLALGGFAVMGTLLQLNRTDGHYVEL